jgi:hypothetical protein
MCLYTERKIEGKVSIKLCPYSHIEEARGLVTHQKKPTVSQLEADMPLKKRKVVFFAFEMQNEENIGSGSRMRVGPASLTFVHPYSEIWESNLTSPSCTPSNQTVFKPQDELGHYERSLSFKGERGNARPSLQPPRGNMNQHRELDTFLSPPGLLRHNLAVRSIENREVMRS